MGLWLEHRDDKDNLRHAGKFQVVDPETGCYSDISIALAARISAV